MPAPWRPASAPTTLGAIFRSATARDGEAPASALTAQSLVTVARARSQLALVARQHQETAKGTVFLLLEDEFGYMNVIVPKHMYERYREVVKFSTFLVIEGTFEREDRVMNIIGRRFRELKTEKIVARSRDFH